MSIESIPVSSFMTRNVKTETEDQNIQAVCKIMNENNIGSVIVIKSIDGNNQAVGIITERDVVRILGLLQTSLLQVPLRELMSKPLVTLRPNNSIKDAIQTMQLNNIRRIPIVDKENLEGIITDKDIFKAIMNNQIPINDLVSNNVLTGQSSVVFDQYREYLFSDNFLQRRQ
ncbi:MAG TPA: CBS domain-containing protein [Nitrososphaeraceae archaeon]|nr:CBS domain-containing protein [Nitrososphaeraceae archaeon]HEX6027759.1 CBS domain-containing protein [Nitrososphaeraceae archaeon]